MSPPLRLELGIILSADHVWLLARVSGLPRHPLWSLPTETAGSALQARCPGRHHGVLTAPESIRSLISQSGRDDARQLRPRRTRCLPGRRLQCSEIESWTCSSPCKIHAPQDLLDLWPQRPAAVGLGAVRAPVTFRSLVSIRRFDRIVKAGAPSLTFRCPWPRTCGAAVLRRSQP
jgi:hypothetical protein